MHSSQPISSQTPKKLNPHHHGKCPNRVRHAKASPWRLTSQLHTINEYSVAICGFCLNILLIWLILKKSVKEMKIYSKILLQTCFIDFVLLTFIGSVQPIYIVSDGWNLMVPNGPFRTIGHPWNFLLMASWFFMVHISISTNCVPFIYRYLVICRSRAVSAFQYFLMLVACALVITVYFCLLTWSTYPPEEQQNRNYTAVIQILGMKLDHPSQFRVGLMTTSKSITWLLTCTYITEYGIRSNRISDFHACSQLFDYSCVWHKNTKVCSTRIAELTKTRSESTTKLYSNIAVFATIPLHWVPLFNPIVTIWVIKPYRRVFTCTARKPIFPISTGVSGTAASAHSNAGNTQD
ncbi:serpentine type 7TM GPCR chemoreceptor srd domain-containing protein [Ditylenchus destructor]|uniref:Serpentine type 7TM GPCR chemoreceptor srd domain-containing protein n=1 Tax=Ditylenchus destructor TaxID=166010 RepID=A0AAD4MYR2_9BILA|nr:serpentine type 7TM GPCR chemoreceptor srd domain-containing protein [Ditylenchus destructor]